MEFEKWKNRQTYDTIKIYWERDCLGFFVSFSFQINSEQLKGRSVPTFSDTFYCTDLDFYASQ